MSEVEPVWYVMINPVTNKMEGLTYTEPEPYCTPLYTKKQLEPRVTMSKDEFDEFIDIYGKEAGGRGNVFFGFRKIIATKTSYSNLHKRLVTSTKSEDNIAQI